MIDFKLATVVELSYFNSESEHISEFLSKEMEFNQ